MTRDDSLRSIFPNSPATFILEFCKCYIPNFVVSVRTYTPDPLFSNTRLSRIGINDRRTLHFGSPPSLAQYLNNNALAASALRPTVIRLIRVISITMKPISRLFVVAVFLLATQVSAHCSYSDDYSFCPPRCSACSCLILMYDYL